MSLFIDKYLKYTSGTESSEKFNFWIGLSLVSAVLQKKVKLDLGRIKVFPNLYIVLVADPGVARKTQSIMYGLELLKTTDVHLTGDATTPQALIDTMYNETKFIMHPVLGEFRFTAVSVVSKEFENILSVNNTRMFSVLTDLYDSGYEAWEYTTKAYGTYYLPAPFLSILGATTPRAIAGPLATLAIGGGLTSRILFITQDSKSPRVAIPEWNDNLIELRDELVNDLGKIHGVMGDVILSDSAKEYWKNWYETYTEDRNERKQASWEFDGWYSRKPLHILKTALCLTASDLRAVIELSDLQEALRRIGDVEDTMHLIFSPKLESSRLYSDANHLTSVITENGPITLHKLRHLTWRSMKNTDFSLALDWLISERKIRRIDTDDSVMYTLS